MNNKIDVEYGTNECFRYAKKHDEAQLIYKDISNDLDRLDEKTTIGKKYKEALEICKHINKTIIFNDPPLVPMNIEAPILEAQIKEKCMHPNPNLKDVDF